jgi:hypothetical protein
MERVKKQNERRVYAVRGFLGNAKRGWMAEGNPNKQANQFPHIY